VSEHLSQLQIEHYRQRLLSPSELLSFDDHLTGCAFCRRQLRERKPMDETLSTIRTNLQTIPLAISDHLTREQLTGYAAHQLDGIERELVESHLEFCEQCSAQFERLPAVIVGGNGNGNGNGESREANGQDVTSVRPAPSSWRGWVFPQAGWAVFSSRLRVTTAILVMTLLALSGTLWLAVRNGPSPATVSNPPAPTQGATEPLIGGGSPQTATTPGQILLTLNDSGTQVTIYANGQISGFDDLPSQYQQLISSTFSEGKLVTPAELTALRGRAGSMMGGGSAERFDLIEPVGEIVFSERPSLRWQALSGAESYEVTIFEPANHFSEVAKSPSLTQTGWTVNRTLGRGRIYSWQVTATKDGNQITSPPPQTAEARFKVLDKAQADEIDRVRAAYPRHHLILGLLFARAGLLTQANQELRALSAANPGNGDVKNLLTDLQIKRRAR
jgi:hypothetical protein